LFHISIYSLKAYFFQTYLLLVIELDEIVDRIEDPYWRNSARNLVASVLNFWNETVKSGSNAMFGSTDNIMYDFTKQKFIIIDIG
jgi:hypothetical protein